ncbi:hypothetical protein F4777DRAFT_552407 [Nemania sp. FL0916]|nr:hypothetical protein F4777DRAFT_552407 [Nemania sp. FL0916]
MYVCVVAQGGGALTWFWFCSLVALPTELVIDEVYDEYAYMYVVQHGSLGITGAVVSLLLFDACACMCVLAVGGTQGDSGR